MIPDDLGVSKTHFMDGNQWTNGGKTASPVCRTNPSGEGIACYQCGLVAAGQSTPDNVVSDSFLKHLHGGSEMTSCLFKVYSYRFAEISCLCRRHMARKTNQ